ncbi:MAG TPA: hypothetical protein VGI46_20130 [Candidatus Acidoferrum sp.]
MSVGQGGVTVRRAILNLSFVVLAISPGFAKSDAFDLVISGAHVVDGSENPWYVADVGIRDGIILEIGDLSQRTAERVIEAHGMVLSPGFIDMMGGTTLPLLVDPRTAQSKLRQGVTTMMAGEGDSMAPQDERTIKELNLPSGTSHWTTFEEYDRMLDAKGIGINVIHNVGAAQVRRVVIGDEDRAPTPEQLAKIKEIVAKAMQDGSIGLSTALIYPPGTYAKTEELIELARIAAQHGGVYFSHMRNESGQLLEAIQETNSHRRRGAYSRSYLSLEGRGTRQLAVDEQGHCAHSVRARPRRGCQRRYLSLYSQRDWAWFIYSPQAVRRRYGCFPANALRREAPRRDAKGD